MALADFNCPMQDMFDAEGNLVEWTDELKWEWIRFWRDSALTKSDWTQVSDNALSEEQREAWRVYRQQLRDLPFDGDPELAVPPEVPE